MNRILLAAAGAALLGFSTVANAADLRLPVDYVDRYDAGAGAWAGGFVGVHAGAGWLGSAAEPGGVAGVQAGYNWQRGALVLGAEIDASWTGHDEAVSGLALNGSTYNMKTGLDGLVSMRAMVGYADGPFLTYLTGGLSMGLLSVDVRSSGPLGNAQSDNSLIGGSVGLGFGLKMTDRTSLRAEASYHALSGDLDIYHAKTSFDSELIVARAMLDYRF